MAQVTSASRLWLATKHFSYPKHGYCTQIALYLENGQNIACYCKPTDDYPVMKTADGAKAEHYASYDAVAQTLSSFLRANLPPCGKYTLCGYTPSESAEWIDYLFFRADVDPLTFYTYVNEAMVDVIAFSRTLAGILNWAPLNHNPDDIHFFLCGDKVTNEILTSSKATPAPPVLVQAYNACQDFHALCQEFLQGDKIPQE